MPYLIVNADDFGLSPGVNAGIVQTHCRGIVTSASLMVRPSAAVEAAELSRAHRSLSVGLHFDLGEWACRDGDWHQVSDVVPLDDPNAVRDEMRRQLDCFRDLLGKDPTHLDSHQHVHLQPVIREIAVEFASALDVPLRRCHSAVQYCGDFYGQTGDGRSRPEAISPERLIELIDVLPEGITELACHPGLDSNLSTMYCHERRREIEALCAAPVRQAVERSAKLISFADLAEVEITL
jgi:chitin disaccharide deacetylase